MNQDRTNTWISITANLGVLVGLVFLIIEINQNTGAIILESEIAKHSVSETAFGPAAYDQQVTDVLVRVGKYIEENGSESLDFYYDTDHRQFQNIVFRRLSYLNFRYRTFPDEHEQLRTRVADQLDQPGFSVVFESAPPGVFSAEFEQFLHEVIQEWKSQRI